MNYILGVDGGGSKTVVQIADTTGKVIAETVYGSSNYKSAGIEGAIKNLNNGILRAIEKLNISDRIIFKSACFGLSGNDFNVDTNIYHRIIFNKKIKGYLNFAKTIICNDTRIGLAAGSSNKNGIIIICGTGSNCFGINEEGKEAKANGWDYILGDEGSGYEIGIKALRAFMREYDGRGEKTLLSKTILEDLNITDVSQLTKWAYSDAFLKDKIAHIAKTVCRTAEMGDRISIKILEEEVEEVVISIDAIANKLDLVDRNFDLVFVGNVFKCKKYFKNILMERLKDKFKGINFIPLTSKPIKGAIKLAIKNL